MATRHSMPAQLPEDSEVSVETLLKTPSVSVRDVCCRGTCRHRSAEECASNTHLVFPYRGAYVRHLGRDEAVAEASQLLFFNSGDSYQVSHPVRGGDACLDIIVDEELLRELAPKELLHSGAAVSFRGQRLRLEPRAQALVAMLRHNLAQKVVEPLEAESMVLNLARLALTPRGTSKMSVASVVRQRLVDRTKLVLAGDLSRRWTLAEIAAEVGGSPVYLTQVFQQVEGMPLYRYQLGMRLSRALDLLGQYDDLNTLSADLGFSSHSHFSAAFQRTYGQTPSEFRRSAVAGPSH